MASKRRPPSYPSVPTTAAQLPVTRAMLDGVRGELVERIAGVESKLTGEIARVESKLTGEIARVESKLTSEIGRVESKLSSVESRLLAQIAHVAGDVHELKGQVARVGVLVEEQNSRNSIAFEALHAVVEQQKRFDGRLDRVEETVRSLASGRRRS